MNKISKDLINMTRLKDSLLRVRQILLAIAAIFIISQLAACAPSLRQTVLRGDTNTVRSLLDQGADVNAKDSMNLTSLHLAANNGRTEIVKLLIERGADINAKGLTGTPLHLASSSGQTETVKLLIELGADIHAESLSGTPLHVAAMMGKAETAKLLVELGANINIKADTGWTPLHWAASEGKTEVSVILIDLGADVNIKDRLGKTALDIALSPSKYENIAVSQDIKETARRNKQETASVIQGAVNASIEKQAKVKKKQVAALKKKQKCKMKESKWIYVSKSCRGKYASGKGVAVHVDGNLRFEGTIKNGKRISGELFYDGQPMFDGPIAKGKPNGKGICYYENEPEKCEFYRGKRVDSIYKQRIALARQNAKQQFEMQQLRADMKKDMSDLKAAQAASGGTQTDSMGNIIKKEIVRKGVNELFNQLF